MHGVVLGQWVDALPNAGLDSLLPCSWSHFRCVCTTFRRGGSSSCKCNQASFKRARFGSGNRVAKAAWASGSVPLHSVPCRLVQPALKPGVALLNSTQAKSKLAWGCWHQVFSLQYRSLLAPLRVGLHYPQRAGSASDSCKSGHLFRFQKWELSEHPR